MDDIYSVRNTKAVIAKERSRAKDMVDYHSQFTSEKHVLLTSMYAGIIKLLDKIDDTLKSESKVA
jgi:hypothetical protein